MSILTMMDKFKEKKAPCTAVIVAAGSSERMGQDKMFLPVAGIPVLGRTLLQFQRCRDIDEIIVVTREEKLLDAGALAKQYGREILACAGDAPNDISMLDEADFAFVPADRDEALRSVPYIEAAACDDGTVADAIERLETLV